MFQQLHSISVWSIAIMLIEYFILSQFRRASLYHALGNPLLFVRCSITFIFNYALTCTRYIALSVCFVIALHVTRASVPLYMEKVFWTPFRSSVTVSRAADITFHGRESLAEILSARDSQCTLMQSFVPTVGP